MEKENKKDYSIIIISMLAVTIIILGWLFTLQILKEDEHRGTFGDMFGSINALYSGLALAGIIITILLQRNELRLQREELKETRKEFKTQNETLKIQRFENTFFNLLSLHHQIVDGINFRKLKEKKNPYDYDVLSRFEEDGHLTLIGRDVFTHLYINLKNDLKNVSFNDIEEIYLKHYGKVQADFGHYFRNLYRIVKLVDETDFNFNKETQQNSNNFDLKYSYTSIVRAQLSDYELLWFFYNCISNNGRLKFKPLIEKYIFFKNISFDKLANEKHRKFYNESAYNKIIN